MENNAEILWNKDLIGILRKKFPKYTIDHGKVLRDIYFSDSESSPKLKLGFADQDIVFYKKSLDAEKDPIAHSSIACFSNIKGKKIMIPELIIELKYFQVTTHVLLTYSEIARNIKSIFPKSKYYFLIRFGNDSEEKLLRNGKNFDNISWLEHSKGKSRIYVKGLFEKQLKENPSLREKFELLIKKIELDLKTK
jgi:hypothetical protein